MSLSPSAGHDPHACPDDTAARVSVCAPLTGHGAAASDTLKQPPRHGIPPSQAGRYAAIFSSWTAGISPLGMGGGLRHATTSPS